MLGAPGHHLRTRTSEEHHRGPAGHPGAICRAARWRSTPTAEDVHTFVEADSDRSAWATRASACTPAAAATIRWRWTSGCICGTRCDAIAGSCGNCSQALLPTRPKQHRRYGHAGLHPSAAGPADHLRPPSDGLCRDAAAGSGSACRTAIERMNVDAAWAPALWPAPPIPSTGRHRAGCWALTPPCANSHGRRLRPGLLHRARCGAVHPA